MKLFVFCLFAVCIGSFARPVGRDRVARKLQEFLFQLQKFIDNLQTTQRNIELPTPPKNIEDSCSLAALECFRDNLIIHFNISQVDLVLKRSFNSNFTREGLSFHSQRTAMTNCTDCASHPKERANVFFERLVSLVQKGITVSRTK